MVSVASAQSCAVGSPGAAAEEGDDLAGDSLSGRAEVDDELVHADPPGDRRATAVDEQRADVGGVARDAVGIPGGDEPDDGVDRRSRRRGRS